jgi:class 3 adenylate cyclase
MRHAIGVPLFLDRHEFNGVTAADAAKLHLMDLEVQDRYGVRFLTYYFDHERQTAFCLARGPSPQAVEAVHRDAHGLLAHSITEVDEKELALFLGPITEHPPGEAYVDSAFRTILFTDMEGSTRLTQQLGDTQAMDLIRAHDEVVREALRSNSGSKVKHTGDGVMASFKSVVNALRFAIKVQTDLTSMGDRLPHPVRVRIGLAAGEPIPESEDLFGAAVQQAARLCARAKPGTILVPRAIRDLAVGKGFVFQRSGRLTLKGFDEPVEAFQVIWSESAA